MSVALSIIFNIVDILNISIIHNKFSSVWSGYIYTFTLVSPLASTLAHS